MRYLFLLAGIIFTTLLGGCEKKADVSQIPRPVIDSFQVNFPHAETVEWEIRHDKYSAVYNSAGKEMQVDFNADGSRLNQP